MESTPLPENRRTIPKHWIVLGLLVVVHAGLGAWLDPIGNGGEGGRMMIGFLFSQPILLAFWAALAPQHFYHRYLWSLLLCILVSFGVDYGTAMLHDYRGIMVIMLVDVSLFTITTFVLQLLRWLSGWQFTGSEEMLSSQYRTYQFGIKHVIALITIVAIGLGLLRSLFLTRIFGYVRPIDYAECSVVDFVLYFPLIILAWAVLAQRIKSCCMSILLSLSIVCCVDLVLILNDVAGGFSDLKGLLFDQLGAALSILISTIVMRFCGFRMIRVPRTVS